MRRSNHLMPRRRHTPSSSLLRRRRRYGQRGAVRVLNRSRRRRDAVLANLPQSPVAGVDVAIAARHGVPARLTMRLLRRTALKREFDRRPSSTSSNGGGIPSNKRFPRRKSVRVDRARR